jgi:hypothetical protein
MKMKKGRRIIVLVIVIVCFMILAIASSSDDEPSRVTGENNENQTPATTDDGNQANSNDEDNQAEDNDDSGSPSVVDERFVIGDTAEFKNLRITADEIIINDTWEDNLWGFFEPSAGNRFVAVRFTIENISDEHQWVSSMLLFEGYVDGVKLEYSFEADFGLEGTLEGDLAPGRRMVGYYGVEVSENATELELEVRTRWLANTRSRAMFVFDLTALG